MDLKDLKGNLEASDGPNFSVLELEQMASVNRHSVLKGIRRQLIVESVFGMIFLAVYYDFFDGHLKHWLWNVLLVIAVIGVLIHNLLGFQISSNPIQGANIKASLKAYLTKIRRYANISITARLLAIIILFGYFLSGVPDFDSRHYWSIFFIVAILLVQIFFLIRVWAKRINIISGQYDQFS